MQFDMGSGFIFSPEDGSIAYENNEIITISGIRQGILKLLLEETGGFVKREEIIKAVWGKDDISIFNASLTQQIYLLRKDLNKAGVSGKIIAHPNEGYKLLITRCHDEVKDIKENNSQQANSDKNSYKKTLFIIRTIMYALMLLNFIISSYLLLHSR